jgi:putative glutamine amidotransferase
MKPLIGITTNQSTNIIWPADHYADAVVCQCGDAGGGCAGFIPSLIAEDGWDAAYSRLDGILFSGGGDISLDFSAVTRIPASMMWIPARDSVELKMVQAAAADGKPFLGICRGCQVVNVALGGTLYTHIPDQLPNALDHLPWQHADGACP